MKFFIKNTIMIHTSAIHTSAILDDLNKYMLTAKNMAKIVRLESKKIEKLDIAKPKTREKKMLPDIVPDITPTFSPKTITPVIQPIVKPTFSPKNRTSNAVKACGCDTLFWKFYIILYGEHEYEMNNSFKTEKEFKIACVEQLRFLKSELKAMKLRISEIEDELANQKKITKKGLVALCLLYKVNILYVWNRKYFEIINDNTKEVHVINNDGDGNNPKIVELTPIQIEVYRETYWCIENIEKPLKAVTSYSKDELMAIIVKLDAKDLTLKNTKKDMYQRILENL